MGRTADYSHERCSVAATLELVGDPWTLLIVREAFLGLTRFEQWQAKLGVARNVLAARLKSLTTHGIMAREVYSTKPVRQEYVLTAKGRDLLPILTAMLAFGDQHIYGEGHAPQTYTHLGCGQPFKARSVCSCCGKPFRMRDLRHETHNDAATVAEALERAVV
jgi:DNA-binding HxlR family transcriptional regulator